MSRLLVICLILLTPLRAWSAESMALQMASQVASQMASQAASSQTVAQVRADQVSMSDMSDMPADCPMLALAAAQSDTSSSPSQSSLGCQSCQLCMTLSALSFPQTQLAAERIGASPASANARFISANPAPHVKPPILAS